MSMGFNLNYKAGEKFYRWQVYSKSSILESANQKYIFMYLISYHVGPAFYNQLVSWKKNQYNIMWS